MMPRSRPGPQEFPTLLQGDGPAITPPSTPAHVAQSVPETGIKCTTCEGTALSNHQAIRTIASAANPSSTPESNRFGRGGGRVQVPLSRAPFTAAARARCAINAGNRHQMHNV